MYPQIFLLMLWSFATGIFECIAISRPKMDGEEFTALNIVWVIVSIGLGYVLYLGGFWSALL